MINFSMLVISYNLSSNLYATNMDVKFMIKIFGGGWGGVGWGVWGAYCSKDHLLQ